MFSIGQKLVIFGRVDWYNGYVITHPEIEIIDSSSANISSVGIIPIYTLTKEMISVGLEQRRLRKTIQYVLDSKILISDFLPAEILKRYKLISLNRHCD